MRANKLARIPALLPPYARRQNVRLKAKTLSRLAPDASAFTQAYGFSSVLRHYPSSPPVGGSLPSGSVSGLCEDCSLSLPGCYRLTCTAETKQILCVRLRTCRPAHRIKSCFVPSPGVGFHPKPPLFRRAAVHPGLMPGRECVLTLPCLRHSPGNPSAFAKASAGQAGAFSFQLPPHCVRPILTKVITFVNSRSRVVHDFGASFFTLTGPNARFRRFRPGSVPMRGTCAAFSRR